MDNHVSWVCLVISSVQSLQSGQNQQAPLEKPPGEGISQNWQILSKIEPERGPEMMPKHRKSLPNGRQQGGAFGAAPRGRRFAAPPAWGSCCLPFGKDFRCFCLISGAHPEAFPLFLGMSTFLGFPRADRFLQGVHQNSLKWLAEQIV